MNAFSSNPCIDKIDVSDYKLLALKFLNRNKKYEVIAFLTELGCKPTQQRDPKDG